MTTKKTLVDFEKNSLDEVGFQEAPPADIVAYNELRSCADLYRMYEDDILKIQPEFQREVVWKGPDQTRFVDSLIKQLPIPSLCFSLDYNSEEWQVIDGLQRMSSLIRFLKPDSDWELSKLEDIDPRIAGRNISDFRKKGTELFKLYRRVENATLPITVLRCDTTKESHSNYLFTIFHRLNTGGMKLNNQEIRNCIFSGEFNNLLKELDKSADWLSLNGLVKPNHDRFRRQEIILRFFAFTSEYENYGGELSRFLNSFMRKHRKASEKEILKFKNHFFRTTTIVANNLSDEIVGKLSLTLLEALLVGVGRNVDSLEKQTKAATIKRFNKLKQSPELSEQQLLEGLAKRQKLTDRMRAAVKAFS